MEEKNFSMIKVGVDSSDLNEAIKKASQLKDLLVEVDALSDSLIKKLEVLKQII